MSAVLHSRLNKENPSFDDCFWKLSSNLQTWRHFLKAPYNRANSVSRNGRHALQFYSQLRTCHRALYTIEKFAIDSKRWSIIVGIWGRGTGHRWEGTGADTGLVWPRQTANLRENEISKTRNRISQLKVQRIKLGAYVGRMPPLFDICANVEAIGDDRRRL